MKDSCLCAPSVRLTGTKSYSSPFSFRHAITRTVFVDIGIPYTFKPISLNPFGRLPAFQDGDLTLFESRAISKYLAYKYKETGPDLLRINSLSESAIVEVWLEVEGQNFNPPISALVFESLIKPMFGGTTDPTAVETHAEKLGKVLDVYEERLSKSKYLAGDDFTLADLHHMPYTFCLMKTPKASLITCRPHVLAWWEDISSRPAWKKTAEGIKF